MPTIDQLVEIICLHNPHLRQHCTTRELSRDNNEATHIDDMPLTNSCSGAIMAFQSGSPVRRFAATSIPRY